ncbi:MAG: rhomboid family intramembrane serine protease [Pseudomonadota bacterium]|nr:rhomboid family intramembrane serine protease [Pseudomonadota bacterium]
MRVELKQGGELHLADVDVEEEVRRARLYAEDQVRHPPWTGDQLRKLGDIPQLDDAFDSPDARFAAFVRARRVPWGTLAIVAAIAAAGALQLGAMFLGTFTPDLGARIDGAVLRGATGYEPLLLDGAWWTPWTSQFLHAGLLHLVANLPVLAYCGFRVERALGIGGLAAVGAAAVLGGTTFVTALGALPVLGASILAYGFWGAQIAIGFRAGDAVPPGWRGFYGWGNLVLFVPLFVAGLGAEGVSHLGHVGGLVGGILVACLLPAESFAPRAQALARRASSLRLAAVLGALPMLVGPAVARLAPALSMPGEAVEVRGAGVSLELPWRMADNPVRVGGMPGWLVSHNHDEPVFCGLARLGEAQDPGDIVFVDSWADTLDAEVTPTDPPPPLRPGFVARAFLVTDPATGAVIGRIVEHDLRRGVWLLRAGYHLQEHGDPDVGREALYRHVLDTLVVGDPPALAEARRERELYPRDPERTWTFGRELSRAGAYAEADAIWVELGARVDGWEWEAAQARARMWADLATNGEEPVLDTLEPAEARDAWLGAWLARATVAHAELHKQGVRYLVARGQCEAARAHRAAVEGRGPDEALRTTLEAAFAPCAADPAITEVPAVGLPGPAIGR